MTLLRWSVQIAGSPGPGLIQGHLQEQLLDGRDLLLFTLLLLRHLIPNNIILNFEVINSSPRLGRSVPPANSARLSFVVRGPLHRFQYTEAREAVLGGQTTHCTFDDLSVGPSGSQDTCHHIPTKHLEPTLGNQMVDHLA